MILSTNRLFIRPWQEGDFPSYRQQPEYSLYQSPQIVKTEAIIREFVRYWTINGDADSSSARGFWPAAVILKETGDLIGEVGISKGEFYCQGFPEDGEVCFSFDANFWGKGFATEALKQVLNFGFRDLGLKTIYAVIAANNIRSQKVLEKVGMEPKPFPRPYPYPHPHACLSYFELVEAM